MALKTEKGQPVQKKKKEADFDNLYSPGSVTQKYEDITNLVEILEHNNIPLDHFNDRMYTHLINFMLHTAKRWDEQIVEDLLHRDEQDGVD